MSSLGPTRVLALTACLAGSSLGQQQPQATAWSIIEQTTRNETVRLLATSSLNAYTAPDGSKKHASLQVRCSGKITGSATISADDELAVKTEATTTLPVRLDDDPPLAAAWANLSLHQILIYDLRNVLISHRRLTIGLLIETSAAQNLTFDLDGLEAAMRQQNCRRRLP